MLLARLICSDPACTAEAEARATTLAELETVACDCGCALEVLGWPDEDEPADGGDLEVVFLAA
jgi:hypothetical protein